MHYVLARLNDHFGKQSLNFVLFQGMLLVLFIGCIDYLTGYYLSFSIFYLIPITFATWFASRNAGIVISSISAVTWLTADLLTVPDLPHHLIPFWNAALRLGFFLIITLLLFQLKTVLERERRLARQDHLTQVYNSRAFYELAKQELNRSHRYGHPLTLAYFDLDNFKTVNDNFGHQIGDQLLATVGEVIRQSIRVSDIAARMGGDEFALLLVESDSETARQLVARIQTNLLAAMRENGWPVTFSIGVVSWQQPLKRVEELIKAADHLMYEVKNNGKNKVRHQEFEN